VTLADLDTFALQLMACLGRGAWTRAEGQAALVFCYEGRLLVESDRGSLTLDGGELIVLPSGSTYRLSATRRSLVLGLERHKQPGLPLPE
jgi:homogentisate 1,2-dioxygenase